MCSIVDLLSIHLILFSHQCLIYVAICVLHRTQDCRPELDMNWIHPWIGLDWIGLDWVSKTAPMSNSAAVGTGIREYGMRIPMGIPMRMEIPC